MGLGEAVWADFCSKMHSKTSPIDLDRFRGDPGDPEIPESVVFVAAVGVSAGLI